MKALKTTLLGVVLLMPNSLSAEIATPDWVKAKPSSMIYYTGVGSASLSDADYRESAKEKALADLISEIDVEIESSSLLSRSEVSGLFSESYANDIRSRAKASLEGHELVESMSIISLTSLTIRIFSSGGKRTLPAGHSTIGRKAGLQKMKVN